MEDAHLLLGVGALGDELDALVTVGEAGELDAVAVRGDEAGGEDVGVDGLVEFVREGLAVNVAGEVLDVGGGAGIGGEVAPCGEGDVFAALVEAERAAVDDAVVTQGDEVEAYAAVTEGGVLLEADARVVLGAYEEVGGAAERGVNLLAEDEPAGAGLADDGDKKAALARLGGGGVGDEGEVEDGDVEDAEEAVVGAGLVSVDAEVRGGEEPVGAGQLAAGDGAVVDVVDAGAGLDDHAAGEEEGIGRGVEDAAGIGFAGERGRGGGQVVALAGAHAYGAGDVEEAAGGGFEVVGAVGGFEALVVDGGGEQDVAGDGGVAGVRIVGDVVGLEPAEPAAGAGRDDDVAGEHEDAILVGLGVGLEDGGVFAGGRDDLDGGGVVLLGGGWRLGLEGCLGGCLSG